MAGNANNFGGKKAAPFVKGGGRDPDHDNDAKGMPKKRKSAKTVSMSVAVAEARKRKMIDLALTTQQRNALPSSAFVYPQKRKYPVPTKAQASAAGISEGQRLRIARNALSRVAQKKTMGSASKVGAAVKKRAGIK